MATTRKRDNHGRETTSTNRIRELRYQAGEMSPETLADAVGVTRQKINAVERAKDSPSLEVAFRIADTFGVPIDEVFQHGT
ncbi:MAG: helix-turn-helix transcriptional regulator [Acidimicrobiia bacterium]